MGRKVGKGFSILIGTWVVDDVTSVSIDGVSVDEIDVTAFGDSWKQVDFGLKDGGTIKLEGNYNPDDGGQKELFKNAAQETSISVFKIKFDNTSAFVPCATAGYWSPAVTTGALTQITTLRAKIPTISSDVSGVSKFSQEIKINGCLVIE